MIYKSNPHLISIKEKSGKVNKKSNTKQQKR